MRNNFLAAAVYAEKINPNTQDITIEDFINRGLNGLGFLIWAAIILAIIYSGYLFITGGGNPDKLSKARRGLLYAIIGVVLVALARIIVYFLSNGEGAACLFSGACRF